MNTISSHNSVGGKAPYAYRVLSSTASSGSGSGVEAIGFSPPWHRGGDVESSIEINRGSRAFETEGALRSGCFPLAFACRRGHSSTCGGRTMSESLPRRPKRISPPAPQLGEMPESLSTEGERTRRWPLWRPRSDPLANRCQFFGGELTSMSSGLLDYHHETAVGITGQDGLTAG